MYPDLETVFQVTNRGCDSLCDLERPKEGREDMDEVEDGVEASVVREESELEDSVEGRLLEEEEDVDGAGCFSNRDIAAGRARASSSFSGSVISSWVYSVHRS